MLEDPCVNERLAAVLTGLSPMELRALASRASLGQPHDGETVFTYEELQRLSLMAARPSE